MSDVTTYDVIIVGAGPGGSAAAIDLARRGWHVLLLEKGTFPRDKVCGDLLSPRSLRVLQGLDCLEAIEAASSNRLEGGILYVNGREITTAYIPKADNLPNFGYALPRLVFDEIVFRQAQRVGAVTVEGCRVTDITFEEEGVTVDARIGRKPVTYRGRLLIGADGVHSVVAKKLGMLQKDPKSIIVALRAYYDGVAGDQRLVDLFFDEHFFPGYGWIFHLGNGRANVGLGIVRDVYSRYDINLRDVFDRWVAEDPHAHARLGQAKLDGRIVGWPLNTYRREGGNYAHRALLIGDAASFIDPINGEGIHTALETAVLAAEVADEALAAGDLSADFLSLYERRWRAKLDLDLRTSDLIVTFIQSRPLIPFFMLMLDIIGDKSDRDAAFASICGGILAGVVPAHQSLTPGMAVKTLIQPPRFWQEQLAFDGERPVPELMRVGLDAGSGVLDVVSGMLHEPRHTLDWGATVASKGAGLFRGLADKYVTGTARYMFGNYLTSGDTSAGHQGEQNGRNR